MISKLIFTLLVSVASLGAHTGGLNASGWHEGILHPFGGIDHMAAMIASGFWAARLGGRAVWALPLAFVVWMSAGASAAVAGHGIGWAESAVALSVLVLGGLALWGGRFSVAYAAGFVSLAAFFHGMAHGSEMPATAAGLEYGAGFIVSTLILHMSGMIAELALRSREAVRV